MSSLIPHQRGGKCFSTAKASHALTIHVSPEYSSICVPTALPNVAIAKKCIEFIIESSGMGLVLYAQPHRQNLNLGIEPT
jgi:hypothetical protein